MPERVETIEQHIDLMMRGRLPTSRTFVCPNCGGQAHLGVGGAPGAKVLSAVAGWCDGCDDGVEMDHVRPWAGWVNALPEEV